MSVRLFVSAVEEVGIDNFFMALIVFVMYEETKNLYYKYTLLRF